METIANIFQAEIIQRLGWTLMHFVWQATAIGLILAIVLKLLHKSSANLRYVIACMALVLIVLMPAVTIRMIDVSVGTIEPMKQISVDLPKADVGAQAIVEMPKVESQPAQVAALPRVPLKDRIVEGFEPALPYIVVVWLIGVFGLSLWHLGGWTQLQRLRRQMVKQVTPSLKAKLQQLSNALGIQKTVGLVESALVQVPTVVGHLKPVILLPASALTGLSPEQIEAILAHELAHIKRCDYLVNMLQTVVEILGFYHPAVWWVSRKIRIERENCCDDMAVSLCRDKVCYAKALTSMEEIRSSQLGLAIAASGGSLFERIRRLVGKDNTNEGKLSWLPSVIAILLIGALLIPTALALSSDKKEQVDVKSDRVRVYQVNRNVSDFPFEKDLSTPESAYAYASKLLAYGQSLREISEPELKEKMAIRTKKRKGYGDKPRLNYQILEVRIFRDTHAYVIAKVPQLLKDDYNIRHFKQVEGQWLNLGEDGSLTLKGTRNDFSLMCELYDRKDNHLEYSDEIKQAAEQLFDDIKDADYEAFLNSKKKTWWNDFPTWNTYMAIKWHDQLVKWICNTFKENPIVKIELGEVFTSDVKAVDLKNLPAVSYKLTLKDGGIIEGVLPFRYFPERKGLKVKAYWQGLHGIDWHLQDEPVKKNSIQDEGSYSVRHFVRVVVGEDGITFQGKQTNWEELPSLLEQVPNRDITVLEVGFTKFPRNLRSLEKRNDWRRNNPAWQKAAQLREQFGFEYLSFVGKHKLGAVSGGARNYLVRPMETAKQIEVNLPSAEDKPLVYLNMIEFSKDKAVITAQVTSYPKTKWDIEIAFFDQKMKRLDYIFKNYENSGIIIGFAVNQKEMIEVDISKIKDFEKAKFFELSIKQAESIKP